jgi:hypothetical protein
MMTTRLLLAALLLIPSLAFGAPPNTLGYQANLADGGGQPITGTRNITFRLYDVPTGGTALWTELQNNVLVDGGNLAVELGAITPLPRNAFGRKLYLGVQLQGDSEMLPRPPLTSAPHAQRAASLFKQRYELPADGTAAENGTALLALLASLPAATSSEPIVVQLDAGKFDLGTSQLTVANFVTLVGQGAGNSLGGSPQTEISSSFPAGGAVLLQANSSLRDLAVRNTGVSTTEVLPPTSAIAAHAVGNPLTPVTVITLSRVAAVATGAGNQGTRSGAYLCVTGSRIEDSRFQGGGGNLTHGLRATCPAGEGLFIDSMVASAQSEGATLRGVELATGGLWDDVLAQVPSVSATNASIVGILILDNDSDAGAFLRNGAAVVDGNNVQNNSAGSAAGIWVQGADVALTSPVVSIENLRYNARGIRITALGNDDDYAPIQNPQVFVQTAGTFGNGIGILFEGAGQEIVGGSVRVECDTGLQCFGLLNGAATDGTVQPRVPSITGIDVDVVQLVSAGSAFGARFQEPVSVTQSRFSARGSTPGTARALSLSDLNNPASGRTHEVSGNRLESDNGCAVVYSTATGETMTVRLAGNDATGILCQGQALGTTTLRCAGNTRKNLDGSLDFLATTCP